MMTWWRFRHDDRLELRARRLLGLGSHLAQSVPRPGFLERLDARLRAEGDRSPMAWSDAVGRVGRPAFGLAVTALLLSVGLYSAVPSAAPGEDLGLLAENDPVVNSLIANSLAEFLAPAERP